MSCEEKARLENEQREAEAAFDRARKRLQSKIGVCPRREYAALDRGVDEAWSKVLKIRNGLDRHIREHGCSILENFAAHAR